MEETCDVKDFFPLVDEINYLCEVELRSSMEKYNCVNEFDGDYVLGLTGNAISGAKIEGDFTENMKLMVEKQFSNGIKIEGGILLIYILTE